MINQFIDLLSQTVRIYQEYAKAVSRPALRLFTSTIIDNEQRHIEELKEMRPVLLDTPDVRELMKTEKASPPSAYSDDISGLHMISGHIVYLQNLFARVSAQVSNEEARILLSQFSEEESRLAKLVNDRLELESLI